MTDSHHQHHDSHEHHQSKKIAPNSSGNSFVDGISKLTAIFDVPATFFREKIIMRNHKEYPYYHRQYQRVPTVDQCGFEDRICIFEANEQYLRDRKVDKFITQILANRVKECYVNEGPYNGFEICKKLDEDYEKALTNYYIKYGDLSSTATCVDAYMKQKHRLIWQRRNPDKDIIGLAKQKEIRKEIAEYQKSSVDNPTMG